MLDPCTFYQKISDATRSITYENNIVDSCDHNTLSRNRTAWYRFTGGKNSQMMPTRLIYPARCGTHNPGWLDGTHPRGTLSIADDGNIFKIGIV